MLIDLQAVLLVTSSSHGDSSATLLASLAAAFIYTRPAALTENTVTVESTAYLRIRPQQLLLCSASLPLDPTPSSPALLRRALVVYPLELDIDPDPVPKPQLPLQTSHTSAAMVGRAACPRAALARGTFTDGAAGRLIVDLQHRQRMWYCRAHSVRLRCSLLTLKFAAGKIPQASPAWQGYGRVHLDRRLQRPPFKIQGEPFSHSQPAYYFAVSPWGEVTGAPPSRGCDRACMSRAAYHSPTIRTKLSAVMVVARR